VIKRAAISEPHALAKALMGKWSEHFREKTEVTLEAPLAGLHARVLGRRVVHSTSTVYKRVRGTCSSSSYS
jgi:hypothetical protein